MRCRGRRCARGAHGGQQAFADEKAGAALSGGRRIGGIPDRRLPPAVSGPGDDRSGQNPGAGIAARILHGIVENVADQIPVQGPDVGDPQVGLEADSGLEQMLSLGEDHFVAKIGDHRGDYRQGSALAQQAIGGRVRESRPAAASMA